MTMAVVSAFEDTPLERRRDLHFSVRWEILYRPAKPGIIQFMQSLHMNLLIMDCQL